MTPTTSTFDLALIWLIAGWAVVGLGAAVLLWALFRDRSRGRRRCPKCWYDMAGAPSLKCPECGREAKNDRALFRTRRKWRWAAVALLLVAAGFASTRVPAAIKDGVIAAVPTPVLRFAAWCRQDRARALYESATTGGAGFGNMGWGAPPRGGTLSADWDAVLIAWYAGKLIERESGRPRKPDTDRPWANLEMFALVQQAGPNARVALPELRSAIESDMWAMALDAIAEVASTGNADAIKMLERAALAASVPETGAQAAGHLARVAGADTRHLHRVRRVLASEGGPQVASTIANYIAWHVDASTGLAPSAGHALIFNELLRDSRQRVRIGAVLAAQGMKDWAQIEDSLIQILQHDSSSVLRLRTAELLRPNRLTGDKWGLPLVRACEDGDQNVSAAALDALLRWVTSQQWPNDRIEAWLAIRDAEAPRPSGEPRKVVQWVLSVVGQGAKSAATVRVVRVCYRFAPAHPEILPLYLAWAQEHPNAVARAAAIDAVARLPHATPAAACKLMNSVLETEPNGFVRIAAIQDLALLASTHPDVLDVLADALGDEERDVRQVAALMLGVLARRHDRAESKLAELAGEPDTMLADLARTSLAAMASGVPSTAPVPWMSRPPAPPEPEQDK